MKWTFKHRKSAAFYLKELTCSIVPVVICLLITGCSHGSALNRMKSQGEPQMQKFWYEENNFLSYQKVGNGPQSILFLHGFGANAQVWKPLIEQMPKDQFTAYLLDLKGAGMSSKPADGEYSIQTQAMLVAKFFRHMQLSDLWLVGHSMGGSIALILATEERTSDVKSLSRLYLLNPAAYPTELPFFVERLRKPFIGSLLMRLTSASFQARYTLKRIYFEPGNIDDQLVERYAKPLRSPEAKAALLETAAAIVPQNLKRITTQYPNIDIPTIIFWGMADPVLSFESAQKLNRTLQDSRIVELKESGHNSHEEAAQRVSKMIFKD